MSVPRDDHADALAAQGTARPGRSSADLWQALSPELGGERPPRPGIGRLLGAAASLLLVAALLIWGLPWATGTTWPLILDSLGALPLWAVPAMIVLGLGALALEAWTVRTAVPGSRYGAALRGHAASSALSMTVPGGGILGMVLLAWVLRRTGIALPAVVVGIIGASLVETVITSVLIPLLGGAAFLLSPVVTEVRLDLPEAAWWAALLAVLGGALALALTVIVLRRGTLTSLMGPIIATTGADEDLAPFVLEQRDELVGLLRRRWSALVAPTLGARVLQWTALVLAIQAAGGEVPLLLTVAIFALGRLLSLVPITPGGAGITETVGAIALVGVGMAAAPAASAVLLLAIAMLVVPLLCGTVTAALTLGGRPGTGTRGPGGVQDSSSASSSSS